MPTESRNLLSKAKLAALILLTVPCLALAAWPPGKCTHVDVLDSDDTDQVSWRFDGGALSGDEYLDDPKENQLDALGEALDMLPQFLCRSVRKVAFVYRPPDEEGGPIIDGWTTRNDRQHTVYLNTHSLSPWYESSLEFSDEARHQAIHRAVHESTHAAIRLLQSQQKAKPYRSFQERADAELWPEATRQMARKIIESNRLDTGVMREWQRIHDRFVSAGMSHSYYGGDWVDKDGFSSEALAKDGFMSAYGGEKAIEDIAEMASWAIVRDSIPDSKDGACQVMNGRSGPSIRRDDAAVFTKLGFVRTLEFITEEQYQACAGSLEIEASGQGFYSYRDGQLNKSYTGNPRAGVGRGEGEDEQWLIANITADGTAETSSGQFPATVMLQLNVTPTVDAVTDPGKRSERLAISPADVSYPRGVYFVGFRHSKFNRLQITNREDGKLIVDVGQGVALISRASSDGIVGSVAVQRIFNYSGGLLSSIAGDEPVGKPTRMTFRYDPQ